MPQLKKMPIGKQDFEMLRKDGYAYVDKTRRMYQMIDSGSYYFLSRPRRFGKSLMVSTLKAFFEGKREVFEGLEVAQLEHDWTVRPVLMLDLNTEDYKTPEVLEQVLNENLCYWESLMEECVERLRVEYDGYHFEETAPGMYNPFSVLNTLDRQKFGSYWFETGTPTYLVTLLQMYDYKLDGLAHAEVESNVLNSIDSASNNPIPVIYQSGYLTIKDYDPDFKTYTLGFPNREVEEGFAKFLLPNYSSVDKTETGFCLKQFVKSQCFNG